MSGRLEIALRTYTEAKAFVSNAGFQDEVRWQRGRRAGSFGESEFLCEAAWVILCSGFREAVVRKVFSYISLCFCDWESAESILHNAKACRSTALAGFNYPRKVDAIIGVAQAVRNAGFSTLRRRILRDPLAELQHLAFIGPVTSAHLAKNLGWQMAKPDRHLVRLTTTLGYSDPQDLCRSLAGATGDPVSTIDIVLWRYSAEGRFRWRTSPRESQQQLMPPGIAPTPAENT